MTTESAATKEGHGRCHKSAELIFPFMAPIYRCGGCIAWPMIRIIAGLNLVPHGAQKLFGLFGGTGMADVIAHFDQGGLHPAAFLAYLVACTEFFGGLMIAFGFLTRFAAAAATIFLFVAIVHVHWARGFFFMGGGFEYPLLWMIVTFAIFLKGAGPLSIDGLIGKEL